MVHETFLYSMVPGDVLYPKVKETFLYPKVQETFLYPVVQELTFGLFGSSEGVVLFIWSASRSFRRIRNENHGAIQGSQVVSPRVSRTQLYEPRLHLL